MEMATQRLVVAGLRPSRPNARDLIVEGRSTTYSVKKRDV